MDFNIGLMLFTTGIVMGAALGAAAADDVDSAKAILIIAAVILIASIGGLIF